MRIRLLLAYDGARYHGWQIQEKANPPATVQGAVEAALFAVLGRKIRVFGAGRTDAGVHARGQVAHFDLPEEASRDWRHILNALLPADIRVLRAEAAPDDFHARASAIAKTYVYHYWQEPAFTPAAVSPWWWAAGPLDLEAMRVAARAFPGVRDFASFQNSGTPVQSTVRAILRLQITEAAPLPWYPDCLPALTLTITANGFLKQMCRNIAGFLCYVGRGKLAWESLGAILAARDRRALPSPTAPACGLTLACVSYPPPTTKARG